MTKPREYYILGDPFGPGIAVTDKLEPEDRNNYLVTKVREVRNDEIRISSEDWERLKKAIHEIDIEEAFLGTFNLMERIERESK